MKNNYNHTLIASYVGYIVQAIVNNFAPLLFLTFQKSFSISLDKIAFLVTINFCVQLIVDFLSAKFVDKIGYRNSIVAAHIFAAAGLVGLGIFPSLFVNSYIGLVLAVTLYAIGGGIIEVLISPIVEACPTDKKSAVMSLLHSFYCWGQVFVVLASTLYFTTIGIRNWRILSCLWALIPLLNAFYFTQVPISRPVAEGEGMPVRKLLATKIFWVLVVLMVCAGASELSMSQWASAFAEAGLGISKTAGDLAGPCFFAILMGSARVFYSRFSERIDLQKFILFSSTLCIIGYLLASLSPLPALSLAGCGICGLSVGILWPGTLSIASKKCPRGGTPMFALLALAGDLGCSAGPTIVGVISEAYNNLKTGILAAIVFPIALIIGLLLCRRISGNSKSDENSAQNISKALWPVQD